MTNQSGNAKIRNGPNLLSACTTCDPNILLISLAGFKFLEQKTINFSKTYSRAWFYQIAGLKSPKVSLCTNRKIHTLSPH